ncbi:MAG: phosphoribosylamine--glycine ligase [Gemmatimonadota bacterium]|nr:phosphoribosylamine--glycine ligase [Gemmatimonadota bacterium]
MKLLLVGGGGREHALAWKFLRDDPSLDLIAAPGNPGLEQFARCVPVDITDVRGITELATRERVECCVVGPEAPLARGLADLLRSAGIPVFGPSRAAAAIESSKTFAKRVMADAGVATARAERYVELERACAGIARFGAPVVIKASGLAAGKGVIVAMTLDEALDAAASMLEGNAFGDAGAEILVEEFMAGEELSLFAITDGTAVIPMLAAQDHKRLRDGDLGPNTGGMGAFAPVSLADDGTVQRVVRDVFEPTLARMREMRTPFTGLLYAGLMLTSDGPKVVEFNCRFGDPETEAILPLLDSSLLDIVLAVANGDSIAGTSLAWRSGAAVTTVLAARGYPDTPRKGDRITLPAAGPSQIIFHAGTARAADGSLVTNGGRVLCATGIGATFADARRESLALADAIDFDGKQFRRDIGWREWARDARAPRD